MPVMTNKSPFCGLKPALAFGMIVPSVELSFLTQIQSSSFVES